MNTIKAHLPQSCYSPKLMTGIDGVVIHYISAVNIQPDDPFNTEAILKIFTDYKLSAHYLITRELDVLELVPLPKVAWHAGYSIMDGKEKCNDFTVGIEIAGGAKFKYIPGQIALCKQLSAELMTEHGFPVEKIQGHDKVRAAWKAKYPNLESAKLRHPRMKKYPPDKVDPGDHFPWADVRDALQGVVV